jgi:hypothetical protein
LGFTLFSSFSHSQFIQNGKGELIKGETFFNPLTIKKKGIKTIKVTFFEKKELQGIYQIQGKVNQYLFDEKGRVIRYYFTKNYYTSKKDTVVEWRYYKNNRLTTIKTGSSKKIKVRSIFYEDNKPVIHILGTSINNSKDITTLKINNYQEKSAEYINHTVLKNGDTLIEWSYTGKTIFKQLNISKKDNSTRKETYSFPMKNLAYQSFEYQYQNELLSKMIEMNSNSPGYYYHFYYNSNQELTGYSKYSSKWNSEIETSELLYAEETGNLQAILTKNKINNSINIRKFNYTYF